MKRSRSMTLLAATLVLAPLAAPAQSAGDWMFRIGPGYVSPNTSDEDLLFEGQPLDDFRIDIDDQAGLAFNLSWFASQNWAVELLASAWWDHEIDGAGALEPLGRLGSVKHLPPTLSLQYHFLPDRRIRPYLGAGLNYTLLFDEDTTSGLHEGIVATANGALGTAYAGGRTKLDIDNSFGVALQAGVDIEIAPDWFLNLDLRWIDIDADAELTTHTFDAGGAPVRLDSAIDVDIDPWVATAAIGFRF